MKKSLTLVLMMALCSVAAHAGGLMTNTNYHIAFDRMFARGATTEIDAVFSNPAGLAWGHEGWQMSLNFQKPWQYRDIQLGDTKYEGKASAPIVPALFASYKKDRWALSTMIGIVGSGGFVEYKQGVPMFNVLLQSMLASNGILPNQYALSTEMKGKQYIYGGQLNFTYKVLDCLSAAVGIRANYYDGYYRGHVIAKDHPQLGEVAKLLLDVDQKGWGFTPIVSLAYHQGPLTLSARYEFRTKVNPKNDTNVLDAGLGTATIAAMMVALTRRMLRPSCRLCRHSLVPTPLLIRMVSVRATTCLRCSAWLQAMSSRPGCAPRWNITSSTTRMQKWQTTARRN